MNYHKILYDDMLNGEGLRVTVFFSGCHHKCKGCHNPQTWDINSGKKFDSEAKNEVYKYLDKDYISGITLSGGDPLILENLNEMTEFCKEIKDKYPNKNIWVYTGYNFDELRNDVRYNEILNYIDIIVDGEFIEELADQKYKYAGSTNQRIINIKNNHLFYDS